MSCYCINPFCDNRQNPNDIENCLSCGTSLLINDRIRLVEPLRELANNPFNYFEVFEVDDAGTQWNPGCKRRVIKVLKWDTPNLVKLIEHESLALQLIEHPNIPESTVDDFFTFVPKNSRLILHCLVMDKFEGENLEQWIESNGRISQSRALEWLKQLVEILDTVHRSDFFHRDIKPSNIVLQPNGQLALIDFGTARRLTNTYLAKVSGSGGTDKGRGGRYEVTSVVTPHYTPLEQINGQAVPQSDFYALGRTFVNLVTATPLSNLPTDQKTGNLIWRDKAPHIDKPFADFLDELMAPFPGQRPPTTRVLLQRLESLPLRSKINRIINSQPFQISTIVIFLLSFLVLCNFSLPVIAEYLLNEGRKSQKENRFDEAQNKFNQAISIKPDIANSVSEFYVEQGNQRDVTAENARKYYELAIKYNHQNDTAYNNLGLVCQQLQDFQCVNNSYAAVFKLKPNKWESHYSLGNFYDDLGKYDLAIEQYELAIKNSELALDALSNLVRIKNIQGEYEAAITTANEGLKKAKEPKLKAALYKSIGWAKYEQKKYQSAKNYLEKAQKLDIQRTDTYCLLAKTQEALGEFDRARIWWEPCLLLNSSLPEVSQWRIEVLKRITLSKNSF
jgi:serine/threonine protein kinase